jgi:hypothetical protein
MVTKRAPVMPTGLHWCKDEELITILRSKRDAQLPPGHLFRVRLGPIDVNCGWLCCSAHQVQRVRSATCAIRAPVLRVTSKAKPMRDLMFRPCLEFWRQFLTGKGHGIPAPA